MRAPRWLLRFLPAGLLTCVAAAANHFPLTFPDSGNYLGNAIDLAHGRQPWFFLRPLTYGFFLVPFSRAQTIWLLPLAQGMLAAWVVDLTLRTAGLTLSTGWFIALFASLSALTSLPWFSGQIMPDIFTGLVILLAFVMVWGSERQTRRERWTAGLVLAGGLATHLSHVPLYGSLAVAALAGRALGDPAYRSWARVGRTAVGVIAPLVLALGILLGSNRYVHREWVLSRSSDLFAMAHLVGTGSIQRYLDRACATHRYLLCAERSWMVPSSDWFLWAPGGTRKRHEPELQRGDSTFLREAPEIVSGTVRQEWRALIGTSLRNLPAQLTLFEIQPGEHRFSPPVQHELRRLGPGTLAAYRASGEVRGSLPVEAVSWVHYVVAALAVLAILLSWRALRQPGSSPLRALITVVMLGVVLNALVVVTLSSVQARYQSRVMWLVPLVGMIAGGQALAARIRRTRAVR